MENNNHSLVADRKKNSRVRKTSSVNKSVWAQSATKKARNAIDNFENLIQARLREATREEIVGAIVAIMVTLVIFGYSLYVGNYLVALIVIAVWVTT